MKVAELAKRHYADISWLLLGVLIKTGLVFVGPLAVREMLRRADMPAPAKDGLALYVAVFAGSFFLLYAVNLLTTWLYLKFSFRFKVSVSKELYDKVFRMEYPAFQAKEAPYFVNRIKQFADNAFSLMGDNLSSGIVSLLTVAASMVFIASLGKGLLAMTLLLLPLSYFGYKLVNKELLRRSKALQHDCADNFRKMISIVSNMQAVKQSADYGHFTEAVGVHAAAVERQNNDVNLYARTVGLAMSFLIDLLKNGILLYSVYLLYRGLLPFADVMFLNMIMSIYFGALSDINRINLSLRDVHAGLDFVDREIMAFQEPSGGAALGRIEKISVSVPRFSYDGGKEVLKDLSLELSAGDRVAVVGGSGCGKSTLGRLLTRIYAADGVSVNGRPLAEYSLASLRKRVYLVSQSSQLFPGTIADNIRAGVTHWDRERFAAVAALPFMRELAANGGLDQEIREGGGNISGGQRQRIMMARLLMSDPDMIIFDESTSALDGRSEESLLDSVEELCRGKIMLYVSHRLSTVKRAGRIVVMKDGRIASSGSFGELAEAGGEFNHIFASQLGGKENL